jgi:arylsulfatase A-like enzyme
MRTGLARLGSLILTLAVIPVCSKAASSTSKPNILIILADDLGYGDLQCYNPERGKIRTPQLDLLAAQGMRFTDAHSSSGVCSPSRYALLTGRYHWRSRLQQGIVGVWERPLIPPERLTIAGVLKAHGYRTHCIGKWHLGWDWGISQEQRKSFQGFAGSPGAVSGEVIKSATEAHRAAWREVFSRPLGGGPLAVGFDAYFGTDVPNWPPYCFIENNRTVGIPSELLTLRLLKGERKLASLPGPALADWRLEDILPALVDRACASIRHYAERKEPFLLYLPLTAPHEPVAVNAPWKGKSGLNAYADFVMETDAAVARVLEALKSSGAAENTLVVFTSDNGKAPYTDAAELEKMGHFASGPFRDYKGSFYEGGHRVPFLVRWPGVVKPGSVCGQLVHHADLLATLAEVIGAQLPAQAGEDSFSILPLLKGGDKTVREHAVSCAANGVPGLRQGSWKLILSPDRKLATPVQLYNLVNDPGETNNLAAFETVRVTAMQTLMEKLITQGRSTPGPAQKNDVKVRRFPITKIP